MLIGLVEQNYVIHRPCYSTAIKGDECSILRIVFAFINYHLLSFITDYLLQTFIAVFSVFKFHFPPITLL